MFSIKEKIYKTWCLILYQINWNEFVMVIIQIDSISIPKNTTH